MSLTDSYLYGTNIGKGVVNVTGHSWLRQNNTLAADTTVNVQDGVHLYLHNEILTNNGVINLTGANSYLTSYNFTSTLTGTGQVVLGGSRATGSGRTTAAPSPMTPNTPSGAAAPSTCRCSIRVKSWPITAS